MSNKQRFQLQDSAAEVYEKVLVPLWMGPWAEALLELVAIQPGEVVLDVACGTGVTTRLAERCVREIGQVTGLDVNASMLSIARSLAAGSPITWIEGDVSNTELASNSINTVICQHGYQHFPDKSRALAELLRVLAPKGRLAMSIWADHSVYTSALCSAVEQHISPEIANIQRSHRETPSAKELIVALEEAGYRDVSVHKQTLEIRVPEAREFVPLHLSSMPISAAFEALSDIKKEMLICAVESALNEYVQDAQIVYPDSVNVVVGYK